MVEQIEAWRNEIVIIRRELKTLPRGTLIKKRDFYYCYNNRHERGITGNTPLIQKLARRAYLLARLKQLETNVAASGSLLKKFDLSSNQELIHGLSKSYQGLPPSYFLHKPNDDWGSQPYEKKTGFQEGLTILTNSGLYVRSKSELIIANALDSRSIPYHYEEKLVLGNQVRYPDFTIKRPIDGLIILWEHFGKMDDPKYVKDMKDRLVLYARHGYIPFHNLICTFEKDVKDSRYIFGLIDVHLLH